MQQGWSVVVPVKPLPAAKTRLRGAVPDSAHPDLVLAMAQDTVVAALDSAAVGQVLVVCDDPAVQQALRELGAQCVADAPGAGLNAALAHGAGHTSGPVAALTADLPALRPAELAAALRVAAVTGTRAYVSDAEGTGTVLLTAPSGRSLRPRFGPDSAARHAAGGARRLDGRWPSLRRDVDTAADLAAATALGLGRHTEGTLCAITSSRG